MKLTILGLGLLVFADACHHEHDSAPPASPPKGPAVSLVTSMVMIDGCPGSKQLNSKRATTEIEELVGPCTKVPGGAAHFSATLLPDGRVELASPSGDPSEGIVPTCLVQTQAQLRHKLKLAKPCKFDVKLEQRSEELK
jgi:hypothetical protein